VAHYPDLSPCDYFGFDPEDKLVAVGWLEPDQPYPAGEVDSEFRTALARLLRDPWKSPALSFRGWHSCACRRFPNRSVGRPLTKSSERVRPGGLTARSGVYNLFVPGRRCVYVAPELILHYIAVHGYAPPKAFRKAVRMCPAVCSARYLKAVVKNGPRGLADLARAELTRRVGGNTGPVYTDQGGSAGR
jgi:hypothetical protein